MIQHYIRRLIQVIHGTLALTFFPITITAQEPFDAAWISAANGHWTEVFRWNTFGFLPFPHNNEEDTFNVLIGLDASPSINLDTDVTLVQLDLASGFIQGSRNLTAEERFIWRGGGFTGGNGQLIAPMAIAMHGGSKILVGFNIINKTETLWTSGDVHNGTDGVFMNQANAVFRNLFDGQWLVQAKQTSGRFENNGIFVKSDSNGSTVMDVSFLNRGSILVQSGVLNFAGATTNLGVVDAEKGTTLDFSGYFTSSANSSLESQNTVSFSSAEETAEIRGRFKVIKTSRFSGKKIVFHPESEIATIGDTVSISKSEVEFNSQETIAPRELLLTLGGSIGGGDLIRVSEKFLWANGTTLGGKADFLNLGITEMAKLESTSEPRLLDGRTFVNAGQVLWSGGHLRARDNAEIVNQAEGIITISGNVEGTSIAGEEKAFLKNEGLFEITGQAEEVHLGIDTVNRGQVSLQSGNLDFTADVTNMGTMFSSTNTTLILSGSFNSSPQSSLETQETLSFSSPDKVAEIRGHFNALKKTLFSGKEVIFHSEAEIASIGESVSISKGKVTFNSGETIAPKELLIAKSGSLRGNDLITVREQFRWEGGTEISGQGDFINEGRAEMPSSDNNAQPRSLNNRRLVNLGHLRWDGGDLILSENAGILNQTDGRITISSNIKAQPIPDDERLLLHNKGLLEITTSADNVLLDLNILNQGRWDLSGASVITGGNVQIAGGILNADQGFISALEFDFQDARIVGAVTLGSNTAFSQAIDLEVSGEGLIINKTLAMASTTQLRIHVTKTSSDPRRSLIHAHEAAHLDGTLHVEFEEGWIPEHGHRISIIQSDLIVGTFREVQPFKLNESVTLLPIYQPNLVTLVAIHDGTTSQPDLSIFNFGKDILLTWPKALVDHRLQSKEDSIENDWITHPQGFENYTLIENTSSMMFFRLISP
jgi:hypothetical protein